MIICVEQGANLHMAQLMSLPLTVSCFSKIQIGFAFLVPAYPGSPGKRAVKRVCVCITRSTTVVVTNICTVCTGFVRVTVGSVRRRWSIHVLSRPASAGTHGHPAVSH